MVATLSPREIEQRKVSPILPSSTRMPRHCSTLLLSAIMALSAPATSIHPWTRRCVPELRLHAAVLIDLTIGTLNSFPVLPSPVPLRHRSSASSSTTGRSSHLPALSLPPRAPPCPQSTSARTPTPASPASRAPHRRSPMPDRHRHRELTFGDHPIGFPSAPAKTSA
jgi:hypothetical protein